MERHSKLVCGEDNGDGGKLLIYAPEENLADGAAKVPVHGFLMSTIRHRGTHGWRFRMGFCSAQAFERQAKKALMLIAGGGLISDARKRWTDENRRDTASSVCVIAP